MGWTGFQSWSAPSPEGSPRALSPGRGLDQQIQKTCLMIERRRNSMMLHVRITSCRRRQTRRARVL